MDPQACWNELQEAVATAMWGTAIERAEALLEWLGRDGFPPEIGPYPIFNRIIARATCEAIAHWEM